MTPGGKRVFHVKICGVTTAADAEMVAAAGADRFWPDLTALTD
jgi:hypothetical protein